MLGKLALPEIRELIAAGDEETLGEVVNRWLTPDLAELVGALDIEDRIRIFRLLGVRGPPRPSATSTCPTRGRAWTSMSTAEAASILNAMAPDDRTTLLAELPAAQIAGTRWNCSSPASAPSPLPCWSIPRRASAG